MLTRVFRLLLFLVFVVFTFTLITNAQTNKKTKSKPHSRAKRVIILAGPDRATIERDILAGKYNHDDIGALIHIGTIESVPALLRVLDHYKLMSNGTMICTRAHALSALYRITSKDLGSTYEAWSTWWEANKEDLLKNKK